MLKVFRDDDGEWWAEPILKDTWDIEARRVSCIDDFGDEVANRLAILLHVDHNEHVEGVGRRISKDTFWLFHEGKDSWILSAFKE